MLFVRRLDERALVRSSGAVTIPPWSAPEPDVVLLKWRDDFYRHVDTSTDDVLLAIEVPETSLRYDRTVKLRLYAEAGVREYCIIDLNGDVVDVCRLPSPEGYRDVRRITRDQPLAPEAFPDVVLSLSDFLG